MKNINCDTIISLYIEQNLSRQEVANILNISLTTLKRYINKNNIHKTQDQIQQQRENTNIKRFGTKCLLKEKEIQNIIQKTNVERYGFNTPSKSMRVKQKIICTLNNKNSNFFKERNIKRKNTCLEKYGVDHNMKDPFMKNKGYINLAKSVKPEGSVIELIKLGKQLKAIKEITTKTKNKTFNVSKREDLVYNMLLKKFDKILRQYKSDLYPFCCDFYIPNKALYIECNFHWTHGIHNHKIYAPYNINDSVHQELLNLWKSKNTKYYKNAIETWTIRDPHKLKIAKENNLNYIVFYTFDEFKTWFKAL